MKSPAENSWFNRIRDLLRRYGLPSPSVLLEQPLSKPKWKSMVDEAISSAVEETWREDIQSKSSLKYINPNKVKVGHAHPVWSTVRDSVYDRRRAQTKCRLLTGTYTLQSNRAVFNQHAADATCNLCHSAPETRQHFLVECRALSDERTKYLSQVSVVTNRFDIDLSCPDTVTRLILDPSTLTDSFSEITKLKLYSRELIDTLHRKRIKLLAPQEGQQSLTVSSLMFFQFEVISSGPHSTNSKLRRYTHVYNDGSPTSKRRRFTITTTTVGEPQPTKVKRLSVKAVTKPNRIEAPEITEVRRRTITDSYEFRYRDLVPISVRTKWML